MKIISTKTFGGRNIYSHRPVLQFLVDLEYLSDKNTKDFEGFTDDLLNLFPNLMEHHCGLGKYGGFVERMQEGTYFGHVVEHLAIELQVMLGYDVYFGRTRLEEGDSLYRIVIEYNNEKVAIECIRESINIVEDIIDGRTVYLNDILYDLNKIKDRYELGPSTKAIYNEAKKRGIPVRRLGNESILELGYGKFSRFIQSALTDTTGGISIDISCNKELTKQILKEQNLPVPCGDIAYTLDEAKSIAEDIGYPIVIKPVDGNQGKGVVLNINSAEELEDYYRIPESYSNGILVEQYVRGKDYRVLVVKDKVCAVAERIAPQVVGDGIHTIRELVDIENKNELRGYDHEKPLSKIKLDSVALKYLKKYNLSEYSIPKPGEIIKLRGNGNISTGGSAIECTADIHPDNTRFAILAAKAIGIDIAGIDIVTEDISKPITECEGAIIEVNTAPGLRMHLYPTFGNSINVASHILDYLFPEGVLHSVPIVATTGTNGKTTTTRLIAHTLSLLGKKVGMTTSSGIYIDNKCVLKGDNTGPLSARNVLSSKEVDIAVLEVARGGIVKRGLGYNLADVAVLTNVGDDHIGLDGVDSVKDLAFVKSLVLEAVEDEGYSVINADDKMAEYFIDKAGGNIILFSKTNANDLISQHIKLGGIALNIEDNTIYIHIKGQRVKLIHLDSIPITYRGTLECNVENTLAASAALYGLKTPIEFIRKGLMTFKTDMNPGRFNIFELGNIKVMIDYGHNIGGYEEVGKFIDKLNVTRSVGVIGVPGDRSDEQIYNMGFKSSEFFSKIYIKEDANLRGRRPGEVAGILYRGLENSGFDTDNIRIVLSEIEALKAAISESQEGDFITLFYEELAPAMDFITELQKEEVNNKDKVLSGLV